jgi:hypothetical protein
MSGNYEGPGNSGRPRGAYLEKLKGLSGEALRQESESKIWLSAYAANNPRSDYHWQCDACHDECARRGRLEIYEQAWDEAAGIGSLNAKRPPPRTILDVASGKPLAVEVLPSAAGFYLGTLRDGAPYSRESEEYWRTRKAAEAALETGQWTARRHRDPPPVEFMQASAQVSPRQGKGRGR